MSKTGNGKDGIAKAREAMRAELPVRFYKSVGVEETDEGFLLTLDGRPVHTPAKKKAIVPVKSLAAEMVAEWDAQATHIDAAAMPIVRLVNSVVDNVQVNRELIVEEIAGCANSDLLFYRAEGPEALILRQQESWDPVLERFAKDLGTGFKTATGIIHVAQSENDLNKIKQFVEKTNDFVIASLAIMTNLTGSILLPLAYHNGWVDAEFTWNAAHVDEDWQISQWGPDDEAEVRRAMRKRDFLAACRVIDLMAKSG